MNTTAPQVETFILGISGKKRSGKDEVAQVAGNQFALQDKLGRNIFRFAFADALKDMFCARAGISRMELETNKSRYRTDLQDYGEKMRVEKGDRYWIDQVAKKIKSIPREPALIIITDVRHINEADWVRSIGGTLWRIVRPDTEVGDNHISEVALDKYEKWDFVIPNTGTLDGLRNYIRKLADTQFGGVYNRNLEQILQENYGTPYRW